jgi:hypothetical protein
VQVRMMTQLLAPGMEHGEETDASAETTSHTLLVTRFGPKRNLKLNRRQDAPDLP